MLQAAARSSTRITLNDRHNTCHAKLSKCCGKLYPSSAIHHSPFTRLLPAALGQAMYWRMPLTGFSINYTFIEWACEEAIPRFSHSTNGRMDGWMDRWKDERKKKEEKRMSCRGQRLPWHRQRRLHAAAEKRQPFLFNFSPMSQTL